MRHFVLLVFFMVFSLADSLAYISDSVEPNDTLKASVVRGERSARTIVRDASRDFSKNYADYYASFLIVRTIECNGKYREVQSAVGVFASLDFNQKTNTKLYWDDRNAMGRLYVCDTFVSESLYADRDEVNPVLRIVSKDNLDDFDALKINYVNSFDVSALDRKRAVEIFSPLNPKMVGCYGYKNSGTSEVNSKKVRVIDFSSNSKVISAKERINCSGRLFIDYNGRVQKIVVKDMDDRFTRYPINFSKKTLVTPYTYTITYGEKDGWIYTESVRQELFWEMPEDTSGDLYSAEWNSCRNPFRNGLKTSFRMTFFAPVKAGPDSKSGVSVPANSIISYNESRDYGFWERVFSGNIDLDHVLKDTGMTWDGLCGQTITRQEKEIVSICGSEAKVAEEKNRQAKRVARAREVYRMLYGKDYTEGFWQR